MSFLYSFLNFLQPGVLVPALADYKPMMVLSVLGLVVGLARSSVYARRSVFTHQVFVCLVIFIIVQVLSVYYAGLPTIFNTLNYWSAYLLFVVVSILLISDAVALQRYVMGMVIGGMFIVIYGIAAVAQTWPAAVGGRAGAIGMYENHNDYSFIIIQIFPFLYMYRQVASGFIQRSFFLLCMMACLTGMVMSLSRGGMLALVLEFMLIAWFGMKKRARMILLPFIVIVGVGAIQYQFKLRAENQGDSYTAADAENSRFELWRSASRMLQDRPLLGVGSGRYWEFSEDYGEISHDNRGKNTHNTYLEVLTGTGILGFVPFVWMLVGLIRELKRRPQQTDPPWLDATRRAALISLLSIIVRATLDAKPHDWSFYILCAIGLTCVALQRKFDADASRSNANGSGAADSSAGANRVLLNQAVENIPLHASALPASMK